MVQENLIQSLAAQLRQPTGEMGIETAERMNIGNAGMNREAIKALQLQANDRVLELGFGNGHFVPEILAAASGVHYVGCDYSQTMVDEAKSKNKGLVEDGRANFLSAEAKNLPFEDNSFQKVLGVNIIYFWDNPLVELAEIKRVLVPGGRLVLGIRTEETMKALPVTQYGFNIRGKEAITKLLKKAGFSVESLEESSEEGKDFQGNPFNLGAWTVAAISTI